MKAPPHWLENLPGPTAHYKQHGRFSYLVWITDGIGRYGPDGYGWVIYGWGEWGRNRARAKAAQVLDAYLDQQARDEQVWTVGPDRAAYPPATPAAEQPTESNPRLP